eukprot:7713221-Lingulodinium_polyedra.AAC.1
MDAQNAPRTSAHHVHIFGDVHMHGHATGTVHVHGHALSLPSCNYMGRHARAQWACTVAWILRSLVPVARVSAQ